MKTIEQLLELSKNPHFKLMPDEEQELHAFLSKKREEESKISPKKNSKKSTRKTNVRVKNVVQKTNTEPEEIENEEWKYRSVGSTS